MRCWRGLWMTAAMLFALWGCSREPQPAEPGTAALNEPAADAGEPLPEPPPADSALAIKRGVVLLSKDKATFQPCGEAAALWMVDQSEHALAQTFATELRSGAVKLYLEAYGERTAVPEDAAADTRAHAGMFMLEEVLYATVDAVDRGCATPTPDYIVAARGNEPSWAVEVKETQMIWRRPAEPKEIVLTATPAQDAEGAVRYQATGDGHDLDLLLDAQPCRDSMAGDFYAYAARAVFDGEEFKGCARVGR